MTVRPEGTRGPSVLCIAGSPRRRGNSERLLEACAEGVRGAGGEAVMLRVADAGIAPCRGCNACSASGECVVTDGMSDVYPLLDAADAIVVSTPVFFATVPAVLKALFDRCQPYWARRHVLGMPQAARRPGALIVVGAGGDPFGHGCVVTATRSVFAVLAVDYSEELVVERVDTTADLASRPEALERARELGARLAGSSSPAGGGR